MDQQQIFATTWRGFEKKAVLDYIYEQDMLFKKKEAEYEAKISDYESKIEAAEADDSRERLESLAQCYTEEKSAAEELRSRYSQLSEELERLSQTTKSKDRELQLQIEINSQLKTKCDMLESKLKVLADHLMAERNNMSVAAVQDIDIVSKTEPVQEPEPEPVSKPVVTITAAEPVEGTTPAGIDNCECANLKEEIENFRKSVSRTLLNYEAALARLESGRFNAPETAPEDNFFR